MSPFLPYSVTRPLISSSTHSFCKKPAPVPLADNPGYTLRYLVITRRIEGKGPGTEEWKTTLPLHLEWASELEKQSKFGPHGPVSTDGGVRMPVSSTGPVVQGRWPVSTDG